MADTTTDIDLSALLLSCSLKSASADEASSTDRLLEQVGEALTAAGVQVGTPVRVVDHHIAPGVSSDEGDGDEWPALRDRVLESDILVLGTPIWLGQPSSVTKRVLERLNAFLDETDEQGRLVSFGRVALVAVVGNEDGAHHVTAELYQALADVGFTIPANGCTYWVGEAMGSTDYRDVDDTPEGTASATATAAINAAHLARLLRDQGYPPA